MTSPTRAGRSFPLGASLRDGGVNFSLYSRTAEGVELLLFDAEDDSAPSDVIRLDPVDNRTYHYWHAFVPGAKAGQIYAYRVRGPAEHAHGLRFDPSKALLDPYARGVVIPAGYDREAAGRATTRQRRSRASSSIRRPTIGKETPRSGRRSPGRSFTRCTSAGSPATRTPASAKRREAPMPV